MKTLSELKEIERQLEKSIETVREAMREQINRDNLNKNYGIGKLTSTFQINRRDISYIRDMIEDGSITVDAP